MRETVARLLVEANYVIPPDVLDALKAAPASEPSPLGRQTLEQLVQNYEVAAAERVPVCQDSGLAVVMLEIGQDVHLVGGIAHRGGVCRVSGRALALAISAGPSPAIRRDCLKMAGDEAPAAIHVDLVPGDRIRLRVASKGFGAENMSALRMLVPADGVQGISDFVVETVDRAGANACPPVIVGVGIGGTFEGAALLAKRGGAATDRSAACAA